MVNKCPRPVGRCGRYYKCQGQTEQLTERVREGVGYRDKQYLEVVQKLLFDVLEGIDMILV